MNERIQELKRQAMLFAQEKCDGQTTDMRGNLRSDIWTEKFAELIVQDCVDIVNKRKDAAIDADWLVDEAMSNAVWDIEEHFGVENE